MTKDEIRVAIAKACGWEVYLRDDVHYTAISPQGDITTTYALDALPDYCKDLNAMHETEKTLNMNERYSYGEQLRTMLIPDCVGPKGGHYTPNGFGIFDISNATAIQRAEAFLRAKGLWKD